MGDKSRHQRRREVIPYLDTGLCQGDGSMIMTLRVTDTVELHSWILGWGANVEVLEPEELRRETIETATAMLQVYRQGQ